MPEPVREHPPRRLLLVLPVSVVLPWLGSLLADRLPPALLTFPPPVAIPSDYPRFSAWAAGVIGVMLIWVLLPWTRRGRSPVNGTVQPTPRADGGSFPWWGWIAVAWTAAWWVLAWTRFPRTAFLQRYTFFPLWFGFIVSVNALVVRRGGSSTMVRSPRLWVALFGFSALFWWLFEWLNRFVQNWHYPIIAEIGPLEYAVHGSLCFSTVLPAVTAVREFLATLPALQRRLAAGPPWRWLTPRSRTARAILAVGGAGLFLTGAFPHVAYPALWLAPLLLAGGLGLSVRWCGGWQGLPHGDWRQAGSWALAALTCGFFWEMWNSLSLARWIYTVPFVERWHVFEMPLLGYAGYLPFGIECGIAVAALSARFR